MTKNILVVEDDMAIRETLVDFLDGEGYKVDASVNGKEALELLQGHQPDLILMDLMMPVMDGYSFLEERSKDYKLSQVPIVVMSAEAHAGEKLKGAQVSAFLKKPLDLDDILRTLEKYL